MRLGLAAYVLGGAGKATPEALRDAIKRDKLVPIRAPQTEQGQTPRDLENMDRLFVFMDGADATKTAEVFSARRLAELEAPILVEYLITHHGGIDGYARLVTDYAKTHDLGRSVPNILGISLDELDRRWRDDLKRRYGA